jgi:hypothetical protein
MSAECSANRNKIFVVLLTLAALALLAGNAYARNPDMSNWTINLSGDNPPEEGYARSFIQEIVVVEATVHVTYWTYLNGLGISRLYYRRSTDGGQTWHPKISLAEVNGSAIDRTAKYLAVDGASVHVAYAAKIGTDLVSWHLMYRRSTDNGATFEAARQLAGPYYGIYPTRIAASGGGVTIAMTYSPPSPLVRNVGTLNSADNGDNFSSTDVATSGNANLSIPVVDLKRVGNRVYLLYTREIEAWHDTFWNTALHCAASLDGGATFKVNLMTTPVTDPASAAFGKYLTQTLQDNSYSPNLAVDGDHVYVVWTQTDTSFDGAYYNKDNSLYIRRSADKGQTFAEPQLLAQNKTDGIGIMQKGQETVAAQDGHVYVMFMTTDGTVYLRRSADNGAGFSPLQNVGSGAWWPNMVVDPANGAKVHVFWWYTYRYSADGGASFTKPVVLMPWGGAQFDNTGTQMALGPGDTKHFAVSLGYHTQAYGNGEFDIFYRSYGPVPAPSGRGALKTSSSRYEGRYDCMEAATSDWFNFGSQMSAEVWVKPTIVDIYWRPIFTKLPTELTPYTSNRLFSLGTVSDWYVHPRAVAELATTDGWYVLNFGGSDATGLVPENAWTHLAMTYDADAAGNNFKLYKNGQLIKSARATGTVATGTGNFFAGSIWESDGIWEISELRLWSKALTQSEIKTNMRRPLSGSEAGLNVYYPFSHTTKDMTGHGNDGILIYKESFVPPPSFSGGTEAVNSLLLME